MDNASTSSTGEPLSTDEETVPALGETAYSVPEDRNGSSELAVEGGRGGWFVAEIRWIVRVLISSVDRFYWDNGFSKAASLAYTSLLSLVPLMALGFGILASFAISGQYVPAVREFLFKQFVPNDQVVNTILSYLAEFSDTMSSLNALVIAFLVITSLLLINSVEYALNETWQVFEPRPIAHRIAIFSAIVLIAPVLLLSAYWFAELRVNQFLNSIGASSAVYQVYRYLLPFSIDFVAFVSLYYLVPRAPVKLRAAIFGAVLAALLFTLAKGGFAVYLRDFATYKTVYQTLAAIPISLFWLYLSWSIVLFGAESSFQAQHLPRSGKVWKRSILSVGDARLVLAVQSLIMIGRAYISGNRAPNELEIAETLGCSTVVLKPTLDALERAGIVVRGDTRDMPIALMRSPDKIMLEDLREALFGSRTAVKFPRELKRLYSRLSENSPASLGDVLAHD